MSQVSTDDGRGSNFSASSRMRIRGRRCGKGLGQKVVSAFLNFDAAVHRQILERLDEAAGPANRGADRALAFPQPEEKLLGVLRQKSGTGLEIFCLAERSCFDGDRGANRIAIAFCPRRRKAMEWPMSFIALRRTRNCGALRFLRITSSRPSWSRSARTKERLSSGKSIPTAPETSENVPSRLLA